MRGTFQQCPKFNRDIGDWETGNVENMQYMFDYASIFNQDINTDGAKWNMGKCEDLQNMFSYALAFEQNLEDWDIKSVTTAEDMFLGVNLSTPNYNALLVGWEDNDHLDDVIFHGGTSKYTYPSSASIARAALEGDGWDITDGGASFPA
jgi:surface protein